MSKEYELYVEADYNDGDYMNELKIIDQEKLDDLQPLFKILKECKGRIDEDSNFIDLCRKYEEELGLEEETLSELIWDIMPLGENTQYIHTIDTIKVRPRVTGWKEIL